MGSEKHFICIVRIEDQFYIHDAENEEFEQICRNENEVACKIIASLYMESLSIENSYTGNPYVEILLDALSFHRQRKDPSVTSNNNNEQSNNYDQICRKFPAKPFAMYIATFCLDNEVKPIQQDIHFIEELLNKRTADKNFYTLSLSAYLAAANSDFESLKMLHNTGANLHFKTSDGTSLIYIAAQNGDLTIYLWTLNLINLNYLKRCSNDETIRQILPARSSTAGLNE